MNGIPAYRNVVIDRQRLADLPTNGEFLGIPVHIETLADPELELPPFDQNEPVPDHVGGLVESLSRLLLANTAEDFIDVMNLNPVREFSNFENFIKLLK